MLEKIQNFAKLVEREQLGRLVAQKIDCEANRQNCIVRIIPGKKYTKVNIGRSGAFMIDIDGNIFGIKGYGVIHRGHHYGTLDTINEWYWGNYYPERKIKGDK